MEPQKTPNSQSNFEEKEQSWKYAPWLQTMLQSYSSQNSTVLHKNRHRSMEQHREPRNKSCTYSQLIYNKNGKNIQWRKDRYWENWAVTLWKNEIRTFYHIKKKSSTWIKVLTVRLETIKLLEKIIGTFLQVVTIFFLDLSHKAKETKIKNGI